MHLESGGVHIQVDTPPDFPEQALEYDIRHIDAVLITHAHADHMFGFDDIRRFNTIQDCVIPAYADAATIAEIRRIFRYISTDKIPGFYRPQIDFIVVDGVFEIGGVRITPLPVEHGFSPTFGYLFEADGRSLGYVPDCKVMPDKTVDLLRGADVVILDALRHRQHKTHMTIEESVALLQKIGAKSSYLVHLCHDVDHTELSESLPSGINVSHDGIEIVP
jgi:phosphoribosyl 1,2-cyclic phosphate phosphodiesterase